MFGVANSWMKGDQRDAARNEGGAGWTTAKGGGKEGGGRGGDGEAGYVKCSLLANASGFGLGVSLTFLLAPC